LTAADATREQFGAGPLIRYDADLIVPVEIEAEILVLKGLAATFVMAPRELEPLFRQPRSTLMELVELLSEEPEHLEPQSAGDHREAGTDDDRLRVVIDQVASLTDDSAVAMHEALRRTKAPAGELN